MTSLSDAFVSLASMVLAGSSPGAGNSPVSDLYVNTDARILGNCRLKTVPFDYAYSV